MAQARTIQATSEVRVNRFLSLVYLVILDWDLPGHPPGSLLAEIKMADRLLQLIVLCNEAELKPAVLAAGADAFVLKGDPPRKLLTALRQVRPQQTAERNPTFAETKDVL